MRQLTPLGGGVAIVLVALSIGGCGGDDGSSASSTPKTMTEASRAATTSGDAPNGQLTVDMSEYKFAPARITADAGTLRVTAKNSGSQPHEFVVIRTDAAPGELPVHDGRASEKGSVGEIAEQEPGSSGSHAFRLKTGRYVFVCNVPGHYAAGMRGSLVVR
jgi:uncharacterized cupredoxin-like copper-binding protein